MLLQPNGGNVGLGTTTPSPIVPGRSVLDIYDGSANGAELKLYSTTTRFRIFNNNGSNEVGFGSDSNSTVHLYTNGGGNRRISILGSGNVGINNSNPQSQLDVAGTIRANEICDELGSNCKDISSGWGAGGDIDGIVTNTGSALSGGTASGTSILSVVTDGITIETNGSNQLQVRDSGVSLAKLAPDSVNSSKIVDGSITNADINGAAAIAWSKIDKTGATASDLGAATSTRAINTNSGSGLTGGGDLSADRNLAINTDNSTLEIATNTLQIKDNGVTNAKINSVSVNKITSAALQYFSYMPAGTECAPNEVLKWDAVTDRWLCSTDLGVSAHSSLTGLSADDHTQYALLAGRSGGQTLIGGTAASNNLTLESTSDSTKGIIVLQPNGGNVGVGTTTPNSRLEVNGAIRVLGGSASDGSNGYMFYGGSGDIDGGIHSPADGVIAFKTNSAEAMRIGPTSNVGIGTTNPSARLEVVGSTLVSGVSTAAGFVPTVDAFPSSGLGARGAEGVVIVGRPGSTSEFSLWRPGLASQVLSVPSGTNNVSFDGNIGIGTASPQGNLHIQGVGGGGISTLRVEDPNTAAGGFAQILLRDRGPASADDEIWSLRAKDNSHFGIGVLDNAEVTYAERLTILRNGNVGIGSLTPNALLDVAGTIRALEICDETGANCKDVSTGWASGGVSSSRNINTNTGSGLTGGGDLSADRSLAINTDNTTLEIATNTLRVKDGGITNAKINSVSINKISSAAAEYFSYMPAGTECTNGFTLVWDSTMDRWLCGALPTNFTVIHDSDNDTKIYLEKNADEDQIRFDTAGSERMIIDSTGRVGIGSNFPLAKLWVQGSGATYNEGLALVGNGVTNPSYVWNNASGNLNFAGNGTSTPVMTVTNGFVGIGTTVPANPLSVATGSGQFSNAISVLPSTHATSRRSSMFIDDWGLIQDVNGTGVKDFSIYQASTGTHRFYIDTTGNIGIGTATPHTSALLDVASTQKGFLPPRMTRAQRNAIATPSQGLMVFNTDDLTVDYYTGATWLSLNGSPKYIKLGMSAANQTVNVGSDIAFDTIRTSSGMTRSGSGVNLKAGVTYRIEASVDTYLGDGNSYLGYQLHNGTSFIGHVAYTGEGDAVFWGFKSAILEIYKPTVDVTVTVRVTDDNIGAGTVHGGWNTNLVVTELVPAGPAGGVSDNMGNHTASQNIALGSFWLSGDGGNEGIAVGATGNVGIGTVSGLAPLHIKGDTGSTGENIRLAAGSATEGGQISLMDGTGTGAWEIDNVGVDNAEYLRFFRDKGETNLTAMVIGTSGNVGIGTINPTQPLHVVGDVRIGSKANPRINLNNNSGTASTLSIGADSGSAFVGTFTNSQLQFYTNSLERMRIDASGNIGIGVANPGAYKIYVAGGMARMDGGLEVHGMAFDGSGHYVCRNTTTGEITYSAAACSASDERLKSNIQPIDSSLDDLLKLRPVTFEWNDSSRPKGSQIGFIAQEVRQVYPELVQENESGFLSLDYAPLVAPIVGALKEIYGKVMTLVKSDEQQSRQIASQKMEIEALKAEDQRKAQEIEALRTYLCQRDPKAPFCAPK
ncbi:MAG: tail fiber domain-containing protein [Bdellovibrionales bacterium]|nr:tail fiber domain-containing protein [Bdellovibrionales bacterium]